MSTTMKQNGKCKTPLRPQGKSVSFTFQNLEQQLEFTFERSTRPIQPIASISINKEQLYVSAIVFIDSSLNIDKNNTHVIQDLSYTNEGQPYLNVYMCYDAKPLNYKTFNAYRFDFEIDFSESGFTPNPVQPSKTTPPTLNQLSVLTSFLWDEDPEGSRGTETTVKRPS